MNLIEQVRETRSLGTGELVYASAMIQIARMKPNELYPTALYVLKDKLRKVMEIANELAKMGIDIFNLSEVVSEGGYTIGPPLVEGCLGHWGIVDGIHRIYVARKWKMEVNTILVSNPSMSLCSEPVSWSEVKEYHSRPNDPAKVRRLRVNDDSVTLRKFYRDLSYLGSLGRRPMGVQNG